VSTAFCRRKELEARWHRRSILLVEMIGGGAAVGHGSRSHNAATALMSAPTARARYSGRRPII
jgi:hypothetical protein